MAMRAFSSMRFCKSKQLKSIMFIPFLPRTSLHKPSLSDVIHKVLGQKSAVASYGRERHRPGGILWYHSAPLMEKVSEPAENTGTDTVTNASDEAKPKRKKLKGKRAVVRWLKFFRFKKKKDYERMTAEEKILFKLRKARKKEERLVEALKKIEPKESSETTHDPEILTPEEHFYFLKMGRKSKNYVPVGVRGVYQGVILNMHLHWKKHETLQVVVKTFTLDEVKEMAVELARLSGGIVLDVQDDRTIIMYRGKNYSQPPTEIMSPRVTLPRKKALDKSKYKEALRSVRKHIPRLEQELDFLRAKAKSQPEPDAETQLVDPAIVKPQEHSSIQFEASQKLKELVSGNEKFSEDDNSISGSEMVSDSEDLSDIFETDGESDDDEKKEKPLYLDVFEKLPVQNDEIGEDFEEHLRRISAKSKSKSTDTDFDEVDRVVLRAASLLKNKRR